MSAYTTLNVTRSRALIYVATVIASASDEELEGLMDKFLEERLYNCRVVADGDEYNNDDEL